MTAEVDIGRTCGGAKRRLRNRTDFAYGLAARVANLSREELVESRGQRLRQGIEQLKKTNNRRELRALRAVFDLHGDPNSLIQHGG